MGSHQSALSKKAAMRQLPPEVSILFSEFCEMRQKGNRHRSVFARKLRSNFNFPSECDIETMEVVIHLWCINYLSGTNWQELNIRLKNRVIHDFLNTLYCTSHAFDELFLLLFTNSKSRSVVLGQQQRCGKRLATDEQLHGIVSDMLGYSSTSGLRFSTEVDGESRLEAIVDFPLKTFSLCPCTRRPLYVAMYLSRPDVVALLVRYGARIPYEDVCYCLKDPRHPLDNVMEVLRVSFEKEVKDDPSNYFMVRRQKNILSLRYVLVDLNHYHVLWPSVCNTLRNLTGVEEYCSIPTLKHICRARIRSVMRGNPLFSESWKLLSLPHTLVSYMSLDGSL